MSNFQLKDIVAPTKSSGYTLRSGYGCYEDAVVVSVDPFVLISRHGDMKWSATVKPEYFEKVGEADHTVWEACQDRLERDRRNAGARTSCGAS